MSADRVVAEVRFVEPGKCPACGANLVADHSRRPKVPGYGEPHCAPCATGIERRATE